MMAFSARNSLCENVYEYERFSVLEKKRSLRASSQTGEHCKANEISKRCLKTKRSFQFGEKKISEGVMFFY